MPPLSAAALRTSANDVLATIYAGVGDVYYVDSTHSSKGDTTAHGRNRNSPFATLDYAIGRCSANNGDVIFVCPGHVETVTAAGGVAIDVAGLTIVGLGSGGARPTINFTTAVGASVLITAANTSIKNIVFTGGIDALTNPIHIQAADCSLLSIETRDVTGQATDFILTTAAATRLLIDGWVHDGASAAGPNSALAMVGVTNPIIRNFRIIGNFAVSGIDIRTTACVEVDISNGYIWNQNSADVCIKDTITGSTGKIGPNLQFMLTDNAANITESVTGATFHLFSPIIVCNLAGEQGMAINTTTSTDA